MNAPTMPSRVSLARRAGLLYLLACITAPFALFIVPSRILVAGDPGATTDRLRAMVPLVRFALATEAWSCVFLIFAAFALYRLFEDVDRRLAAVMAVMMWVAVPIQLLNLVFGLASLMVTTPIYAASFTKEQVDGLSYLFFRLHGRGIEVAQIFWGLWLFPWGILAIRGRFIPRWIGIGVLFAGFGYVAASAAALFGPASARDLVLAGMALGVGELPMSIWLLVWGARESRGIQ